MNPPLLLTGFEPFGGDTHNPSAQVALALHGRQVAGRRIVGAVLPTAFGASLVRLDQLLARHQPDLVLCLGLAASRQALSLERVAINLDDARIPDNLGQQPADQAVVQDGPSAYFGTLPVKAMVQAIQAAGLPAELSHSAGTFVCNHVFYGLMHRLAARTGVRGGFMHLPQPGVHGVPLDGLVRGTREALRCAVQRTQDLGSPGGALD